MTPDLPADPGLRVGKYVKVAKLGEGGMGEVWKAWDTELERWVALKFLKQRDPEERARFRREAQTAARLSHPGIGALYEANDDCIAMQFIDGVTLQGLPKRDPRTLAALIRQAALAVHYAHEQGVIHRDLKPANIMVESGIPPARPKPPLRRGEGPHASRIPEPSTPAGMRNAECGMRVYVMDFGLAKRTSVDASLSASGVILGTPAYMSPEQASGRSRHADARSDVYSLGATLYELLARQPPFRGASVVDLLEKVVREDPPPLQSVPRDLGTIVMKCLEKDPARRYATAAAFADDLARWLNGEAIAAHPPSALYRGSKWLGRRRAFAGAVAAALVGMAAIPWLILPRLRAKEGALARQAQFQPLEDAIRDAQLFSYMKGVDFGAKVARVEAALAELQKVEPKDAAIWRMLGLGRHFVGDLDRAEEALLKAAQLAPGDGSVHFALGRIHLERGLMALVDQASRSWQGSERETYDWSRKALEHFARTDGRWIGSREIDRHILEAYRALGEHDNPRAGRICRDALARFEDAMGTEELWVVLGFVSPDAERIECCSRAIERRPQFAWPYFFRGMTYQWTRRTMEAIEDYSAALRINPRFAAAHFNRGYARQAAGHIEGAAADFDATVRLEPRYAGGFVARADLKAAQGDLAAALRDYDEALRVEPGSLSALVGRGIARDGSGDIDAAIADFTEAARRHPKMPQPFHNRAIARARKGDHRGAVEDYSEVLRLTPGNLGALVNRGLERRETGDRIGAVADFTEALRMAPADWPSRPEVERLLADVRE